MSELGERIPEAADGPASVTGVGQTAGNRLAAGPYGWFDAAAREFVITRPDTPTPWINYIGEGRYGGIVSISQLWLQQSVLKLAQPLCPVTTIALVGPVRWI